jgi:hypothetical protein
MPEIDGSTRINVCCIGGAYKLLSLCVSIKDDSSSEKLVNLYNLEL